MNGSKDVDSSGDIGREQHNNLANRRCKGFNRKLTGGAKSSRFTRNKVQDKIA